MNSATLELESVNASVHQLNERIEAAALKSFCRQVPERLPRPT